MKKLLLFIGGLIFFLGCTKESQAPLYVWSDPVGTSRADYVMFRNEFNIDQDAQCSVHLFVDSRYHLFVNGEHVNFGPVRFYPEKPQYDTYEVSSLLRKGKNVIAVKAYSNGTNTYQIPLSKAGFISWGEVRVKNKVVHDLTTPGKWLCMPMNGYDTLAPKMSFATGPMEIYDARKDPEKWKLPSFDASDWVTPELKNDQDHWGELSPRTIPHLTQDKRPMKTLMGSYALTTDEKIYSFRVKSADRTRAEFRKNRNAFAYTYIYSPKKQKVAVGSWWGSYWINGEGPIEGTDVSDKKPSRIERVLELNEGWNFLFVKYGIVWASWEYYMAVPTEAGLVFNANKNLDGNVEFMTAGPFEEDEEEIVGNLDVPFKTPGDLPDLSVGWKPQTSTDGAGNPAWEVAWSYFDHPIQVANESGEAAIPGNQPVGLVYDIGQKTLGRFYMDIEAPEGTVVDVVFAEDLKENRPWILKRFGIFTGLRYVVDGGRNTYESFKPYGARFFQVNIRNASSEVKIHDIGMYSQVYPFNKTGSFECSDTMLNAIWELGWRTLVVCSEDSYTDTPFRERGLYAGDALPEYAITLSGSGDSRLLKHCTHLYSYMYNDLMNPGEDLAHGSVNHMADYPMLTLLSWVWSVNRTGDLNYAEKYYEGYKNMMKVTAGWRMSNGLLDHPRAFIEWTEIDKNATLTAIQSLSAYCFNAMAYMSDILGKDDRDWFLEEERKTLEAMHELCWDEEKGAFRDGFRDGKPIDHHYPISSIWPSLFGQTTPEQEAQLEPFYAQSLEDIGDKERQRLTTPYGGFYVIDALYNKGYTMTAEKFMKKYWSPMILKHGDTAWENFGDGADGKGQGTLSHAWSGGPTYHMTRHILGVDLGFPQFSPVDTLIFTPQSETVNWARGSVPHPKGLITVDWRIDGDVLIYNVELPEGIVYEVRPKGRLAKLELHVNQEKKTGI